MVQTITPVVHGGRRSRWQAAVAIHTVGAGLAAGALGAVLGAGGSILGAPWGRPGAVFVGGIALLFAAREAFALPIPIPDRRRQVPEWWRSSFSANAAAFLYGLGLGVGFFTYLRYGTLVAVSAVAIASGDPLVGAVVIGPFGLARGLSVAVVSKGTSTDKVQGVVEGLESWAERAAPKIANAGILLVISMTVVLLPVTSGGEKNTGVISWILVLVFGWAAVAKLARFATWRDTLRGYALPRPLETLALPVVPAAEMAVALLGVSGRTRESAALSAVLLVAFSGAVLRARARGGQKLPCGCFGQRRIRDYRAMLARNLGIGVLAAAAFLPDGGQPLLDGFRGPHPDEAVPALLVLLGLLLGASVLRHIRQLRASAEVTD